LVAIDLVSGESVSLFNPRMQVWSENFRWVEGGLKIEGLTATVRALRLSEDSDALVVRSFWVQAEWHPPVD
jgi:hypothetical protein